MYGSVEEGMDQDGIPTMRVMSAVDVKQTAESELTLEWDSSAANDMIADSTLAVITEIDKSPASVKMTTGTHTHRHEREHHPHSDHDYTHNPMVRIQRLGLFLEAHFGEVEYHMPDEDLASEQEELASHGEPSFLIQLDDAEARINLLSMTVDSSSEAFRRRVEAVLEMAVSTVSSLSESFASGAPEEFSSGRIHKPTKDDVRLLGETEGDADQAVANDDGGSSPEVEIRGDGTDESLLRSE